MGTETELDDRLARWRASRRERVPRVLVVDDEDDFLELSELVVDGDPQRLEDALGRVTFAEPGGGGNGCLDRVDELPVRSNGCLRRRRPIARAICRA